MMDGARESSSGTGGANDPSESNRTRDGHTGLRPATGLRCPLERRCQLSVINPDAMLVACNPDEPHGCPKAIRFGDGQFCGALLKM